MYVHTTHHVDDFTEVNQLAWIFSVHPDAIVFLIQET